MIPPGWRFEPVTVGSYGLEFALVGPQGTRLQAVCALSDLSIRATALHLALDAWIAHENERGAQLAEELEALDRVSKGGV